MFNRKQWSCSLLLSTCTVMLKCKRLILNFPVNDGDQKMNLYRLMGIIFLVTVSMLFVSMEGQAQGVPPAPTSGGVVVDPTPTPTATPTPIQPGQEPPGGVFVPPVGFEWWMEPRYEEAWKKYDRFANRYPHDFVYPDGWFVGLTACSRFPNNGNIEFYKWDIEGIDDATFATTIESTGCKLDQNTTPAGPKLPSQGFYKVTLSIKYNDGSSPHREFSNIKIQDMLIISMGDSSASGEGNSMTHSELVNLGYPDDILTQINFDWLDRRCHRSLHSGHAYMAKELEESDAHTSVTFLSFACSGGKVLDGLILPYKGIEGPGNGDFVDPTSQLRMIIDHVCNLPTQADCVDNPRNIDKVFISAGVNDLKFSTVIKACARPDSLEGAKIKTLLLPGVINAVKDFDFEDIADQPIREAADFFANLSDAGLGIWDEIFLEGLFRVFSFAGWDPLGEEAKPNCHEHLQRMMDTNSRSLWLHYDVVAAILNGNTMDLVSSILADDPQYHWIDGSNRDTMLREYRSLSNKATQAIKADEVYITSYPVDLLTNRSGFRQGCGVLREINNSEAEWLYDEGKSLNLQLAQVADKHYWLFVDGITERFQGNSDQTGANDSPLHHGYCADAASWYVQFADSFWDQGNGQGMIHPNKTGHEATQQEMAIAIDAPKPDYSNKYEVTIRFDEFTTVYDSTTLPLGKLKVNLSAYDYWKRDPFLDSNMDVAPNKTVNLSEVEYSTKISEIESIVVEATTKLPGDTIGCEPASDLSDNPPGFCNKGYKPGRKIQASVHLNESNEFGLGTTCSRTNPDKLTPMIYDCQTQKSGDHGVIKISFEMLIRNLNIPHIGPAPDALPVVDTCVNNCPQVSIATPEPLPLIAQTQQTVAGTSLDSEQSIDFYRMYSRAVLPFQIERFGLNNVDARAYGIVKRSGNGKTLLVGQASTDASENSDVMLVAYLGTGAVDSTFGTNGVVLIGGNGNDHARDVVVQEDEKIVVVGTHTATDIDFGIFRFNADGSVDTSFDTSGLVTIDFGQGDDFARRVLLRPDGHIIIAGYASDGSTHDYALAQLNPDGSLDTTFGIDGLVRTDVGSGFAHARAAALQADGKVILAGGHVGKLLLVRYLVDGSLDADFGVAGKVELDLQRNSIVEDIAMLEDGRLALTGYFGGDLGLLILDTAGNQIGTPIFTDFGGDESAYAMAVQPDGKIYVVGGSRGDVPANGSILLARYTPDGTGFVADPTFDVDAALDMNREVINNDADILGNGQVTISIDERSVAKDIWFSPSGDLIMAGFAKQDEHDAFVLVNLETDYTVDFSEFLEAPTATPTPTPEATAAPLTPSATTMPISVATPMPTAIPAPSLETPAAVPLEDSADSDHDSNSLYLLFVSN